MPIMKLDYWFVKENELSISLTNFYVSIHFKEDCDNNTVQLTTYDENMEKINFTFLTLEDAIVFTEEKMKNRLKSVDVIKDYQVYYEENFRDEEDINKTTVKRKTVRNIRKKEV